MCHIPKAGRGKDSRSQKLPPQILPSLFFFLFRLLATLQPNGCVCVFCMIFGCKFFDLDSVVSLITLTSLTFYSLKIDISTITSSLLAAGVGWLDFLVSALLSI